MFKDEFDLSASLSLSCSIHLPLSLPEFEFEFESCLDISAFNGDFVIRSPEVERRGWLVARRFFFGWANVGMVVDVATSRTKAQTFFIGKLLNEAINGDGWWKRKR